MFIFSSPRRSRGSLCYTLGVGVPSWLKFLEQVYIDAYNWLITGPILPKLVWMMLLGVMKEYIGLNTESEP